MEKYFAMNEKVQREENKKGLYKSYICVLWCFSSRQKDFNAEMSWKLNVLHPSHIVN